jgi:hypothetical protein
MAFSLLGALVVRAIVGDVHAPQIQQSTRGVTFALIVFGVFVSTNIVNFALIAVQKRVLDGRGLIMQVRTLLIPMLPVEFAASILAAILAVAYTNLGYPALAGVVMVILIFQYLARALLRSEDRAEQLEARSVRLASMQLGMLATLVETLALRDRRTARHAAAVARYARALARELGSCTTSASSRSPTASCTPISSPTRTGRSCAVIRRTARPSSAVSTAMARWQTRSSTTTSTSTAAAIRLD